MAPCIPYKISNSITISLNQGICAYWISLFAMDPLYEPILLSMSWMEFGTMTLLEEIIPIIWQLIYWSINFAVAIFITKLESLFKLGYLLSWESLFLHVINQDPIYYTKIRTNLEQWEIFKKLI